MLFAFIRKKLVSKSFIFIGMIIGRNISYHLVNSYCRTKESILVLAILNIIPPSKKKIK